MKKVPFLKTVSFSTVLISIILDLNDGLKGHT